MSKNFEMNSDELEIIQFFITALWCRRHRSFFNKRHVNRLLQEVKEYDARNTYYRQNFDIRHITPVIKKVIFLKDNNKEFKEIKYNFRLKIINTYYLEDLLVAMFNIQKHDIYHPRSNFLKNKYYEETLFSLGNHYYNFFNSCQKHKITFGENDIVNIYRQLFRNNFFSKKYTDATPNGFQKIVYDKFYCVRHDAANLCVRLAKTKKFFATNPS